MAGDADSLREQLRISCADSLELMTTYLEDALGGADRERLEDHLEGCEACAVYLDQLRTTVTIVGTVKGDDSYEVDDETMSAMLEIYEERRRGG